MSAGKPEIRLHRYERILAVCYVIRHEQQTSLQMVTNHLDRPDRNRWTMFTVTW